MKGTHKGTYYYAGGIRTLDYIKAKLTPEQYEGFLVGNVLKYTSRYRLKGGIDDLKKAQDYLTWLIEFLEKTQGAEDEN